MGNWEDDYSAMFGGGRSRKSPSKKPKKKKLTFQQRIRGAARLVTDISTKASKRLKNL